MSSRAASDEVYDEDEEVGDSISVVASLARRRRAGSARGSDVVGAQSDRTKCWLLWRARATDEDLDGRVARHVLLERHTLSP